MSLCLVNNVCDFTASAHVGDYFSGTYTSTATSNPSFLKLKIEPSAQTSLLTADVYYSAYQWCDISSNVEIGIAIASSAMPSTGFYSVCGKTYDDGTLGELLKYDSNGNIVGANANWASIRININNSTTGGFYDAQNPTLAAQKTFIHEVGHALKLSHPTVNSSLSGHTYADGRPFSVMNQGFPNYAWIASSVRDHDAANLIGKWGN